MLSLLILVVFGLGVGLFAAQNTGIVHIALGNYFVGGVPLYVIVIGSMLLGIFVSWLLSLVTSISSSLRFHGKVAELKEAYRTIESLNKENNALLRENAHLKGEQEVPYEKEEDLHEKQKARPSLFYRLRHSYT